MRLGPPRACSAILALALVAAPGCEGNPGAPDAAPPRHSLDDFLPPTPPPDGTARAVWAGTIDPASPGELIEGPARIGVPGDLYLRNAEVRFVIQAPGRAIGVNPYGGTVVDGALAGAEDHLGEVGFVYAGGRTCDPATVEVLLDGAGGGPAVVRARGRSAILDTVSLRSILGLDLREEIDPDLEDGLECAATYTLWPGARHLEIAWTLFNPGARERRVPFGAQADVGGATEPFAPGLGFHRGGVEALSGDPTATPYDVQQGPGVAFGVVPDTGGPDGRAAIVTLGGAQILLYGATGPLDLIAESGRTLVLPPDAGATREADLVLGRDAADVEAHWLARTAQAAVPVAGEVRFAPSGIAAAGARVAVFRDGDGDGALDEEDPVVTYTDAGPGGTFALELAPGAYLARADVDDAARSEVVAILVSGEATVVPGLTLPEPALLDYVVVDDETGAPVPAKLTIVGAHPAPLDARVSGRARDRRRGVVATVLSPHGRAAADGLVRLPAGGPYRVFVTRGPEWSLAHTAITPAAGAVVPLEARLRRVVDTTGYVACEFHVHALGSPDATVSLEDRVASLAAEGIELVAATDHDFLSDLDPVIDEAGLRGVIDAVVGVEATTAAWGHFNAHPLARDPGDPSGGAVDWADGEGALDLAPVALVSALRARGARVVQANHPRTLGASTYQAYFDSCGLAFDFAAGDARGDASLIEVPPSWMRLPDGVDLCADEGLDVLEVWNGFAVEDTDGDGARELTNVDLVLRDWMSFLSIGRNLAPAGNSDSHTREADPAGLPRSLVRVPDDSAAGLLAGVEEGLYATLLGAGGAPRDVVVTDGPMIRVSADGGATSAIGRVVPAEGEAVTLTIEATTAGWTAIDTIELFANATFDPLERGDATALAPLACFTSRELASLAPSDPCRAAPLGGARPMTVEVVLVGGGAHPRRVATVTIVLSADDVAAARTGARGRDAWIVVRARGDRAVFPVLVEGALGDANLAAVVAAETDEALAAALAGRGVPALAFTAPVLVDFDGGGYRAPFAP